MSDVVASSPPWLTYFVHRLDNKRQGIFETNSMISRKSYGRQSKLAKYDITNTYNSFYMYSKRDHLWFIFVMLSEIVGVSCIEFTQN